MINSEEKRRLLLSFIDQFPLKEDIKESLQSKLQTDFSESALTEVTAVLRQEVIMLGKLADLMEIEDEIEFEKTRSEIYQLGQAAGVSFSN